MPTIWDVKLQKTTSKMRTLILFTSCLCFVVAQVRGQSDEIKELMQALHNQCRDEIGIAEEVIVRAQKDDYDENDEKLQCYVKCLMSNIGAMDETGQFDAENALASMPPEMVDKVGPAFRGCQNTDGPNPCKKALNIHKCLREKAPNDMRMI